MHKVDFKDTAKVVSGSVSDKNDCRICDLKEEFNKQINASSAVIFVVGDKTAIRIAGSECSRADKESRDGVKCTPYKENANGKKDCKVSLTTTPGPDDDVGCINSYSYLRHEFEQAKKKDKDIIVVYNSLNKQSSWLPSYLKDYEDEARPFWIRNTYGEKVGDYNFIKQALGYE